LLPYTLEPSSHVTSLAEKGMPTKLHFPNG
jgi:hypothetical protein